MARLIHKRRTSAAIGALLLVLSIALVFAQEPGEKYDLTFEPERRVNAHGDEFNALSKSSDGKRIFTATEKGEIIVWNIATNHLERTLRQPTAFHLVAALADPREFVAAGSNHLKPINALARKWNVETGEFVDLPGVDPDSMPIALAVETVSGLIALTTRERKVLVWDARTNKQLANWTVNGTPNAVAVLGRDVYVGVVEESANAETPQNSSILKLSADNPQRAPAEFLRVQGRAWTEFAASPDYRLLRATYYASGERHKIAVIDPQTKFERGNFEAQDSLWIDKDKLMLWEWMDPVEVVQVSLNKPPKNIRKFERFESDGPGRAFGLSGQVSNADGSKAWASYRQGPGLMEFNLATKKIKTLIGGPSGAYALSVLSEDGQTGEVLTGGADGYVRLWKLAGLSLVKEYKVADSEYFVRDAVLVPGSRRAVIGIMRMDWQEARSAPLTTIILLDLDSGQQKKLFDAYTMRTQLEVVDNHIVFAEFDRIKFSTIDGVKTKRELEAGAPIIRTAVSDNNRWLAAVDESNKLTIFDLTTGEKRTMPISEGLDGPMVVTNDGSYVSRIGHDGTLTTWDITNANTTTSTLNRIREMHTRVDFMTLANNDRWLVTAGNHRDVAIFDRTTSRLLFFIQSGSAAVYVEKVWIKGNRIIMTGDTGVMHSGVLK